MKRRFRFPEGVTLLGQQGETYPMQVSIPLDPDGFLGRQCPNCEQSFRMNAEQYDALPDDQRLWCVYCGHHDDHSEYMTEQQTNRVLRAVGDLGVQLVGQVLDESFGRGRRSGRGMTFRRTSFRPRPLPGISEERLIRVRICQGCEIRYAVFAEHRYCPVCGPLPATVVASDALAAEKARLDALDNLPPDTAAPLREQGVFDRIWVDTLENLVSIVETLARGTYEQAVPTAAQTLRGKGNIFQRLDDTADLFAAADLADPRAVLNPATWRRLGEAWAARHVFSHNDGIVDQKYLTRVPQARVELGQRLTITAAFCRQTIVDVEALCRALT